MRHLLLVSFLFSGLSAGAQSIRVGAKHFNEGYILSEIISQQLEARGFTVERRYHLSGTLVCFEALRKDEIDVYPEYTGTISAEILRIKDQPDFDVINSELLERYQLQMAQPFGFSNSYALVVNKVLGDSLQIRSISDLESQQQLRAGISYEFLKRADGWEQLIKHYNLSQQAVGMEHGLAYQAMDEGLIDITDAYSTDGEIVERQLLLLEDDQQFFPEYNAVILQRADIGNDAMDAMNELSGSITEKEMQVMNAQALRGKNFELIASEFLTRKGLTTPNPVKPTSRKFDLFDKTLRHLSLVLVALFMATAIAVPLGIALHWNNRAANIVLYLAGLLQTIPSIALLAIMIPVLGIGVTPAIVALFLYALLPILRNTVAGLRGIDPLLTKIAAGIGMTRRQKLMIVELPLAMPFLLAGIRTAAVISVGTATLAAFIGAGGLGEYIVTGLALNNTGLILKGAVPAAVLAVVVELLFEVIERRLKKRANV
jgi:osmoprotectant transport system permease protein